MEQSQRVQVDMNALIEELRNIISEQAFQIALLRAAGVRNELEEQVEEPSND